MYLFFLLLVFIIITVSILAGGTYFNLNKKDRIIYSAWQDIVGQLQRRYDLIPFLVEVINSYTEDNPELLNEITNLRNSANSVSTVSEHAEKEEQITQTLSQIFELFDEYPDLINDENYTALKEDFFEVEEMIQVGKTYYNDNVEEFNALIKTFPVNLIAKKFGLKPKEPFDYEGEFVDFDEEYNEDESDIIEEAVGEDDEY